jgi:hypothetical protein
MTNAFKFPNFFFHCEQICSFLYTFKKINGALHAKRIHVAHMHLNFQIFSSTEQICSLLYTFKK